MKGKKLLITLAASAVLFAGCGLKSGETIIKVNDTNITQAQFDKMFEKQVGNSMISQLGINIKDSKNTFLYNLIKERVVNELIVKALLDEEIAKRDITVSNKDVEDAIKEIVDKVGSKDQLNNILKKNGISANEFKADLKEEIKMKKLAKELGSSDVSDSEAQKFYNDNADKFKYPDRVRASHILISANPAEIAEIVKSDPKNKDLTEEQVQAKVTEEMNAKKAKADKLLAQAKADTTQFAKLAKENSDDTTTAVKGGDLGFFAAQEMVPEFSKAAFSMKPNTISQNLVKSKFGYHIIMVVDRMAAGQDSFEKAKPDIMAFLENQKQLEAIDKLVESLKKNAKIEYVNTEYDPENINKTIQEQMNKGADKKPEAKTEKPAQNKKPAEQKK